MADKWHLLKNLGEVVQRLLAQHLAAHRKHQQAAQESPQTALQEKRSPRLSKQQEQVVGMHREHRVALYDQVLALHKQGMSQQAIAQQTGIGHSTVSNWLRAESFPERKRREQASQLDRYLPFIRERWAGGCHNTAQIHREVTLKGYKGSYASVHALVTSLRQGNQLPPAPNTILVSSREATWLFLRRPEELTAKERATIELLCTLDAEVRLAYTLVQQFAFMLRTQTGEHLDAWLEAVAASSLIPLHAFAAGIAQDKAAVQAG